MLNTLCGIISSISSTTTYYFVIILLLYPPSPELIIMRHSSSIILQAPFSDTTMYNSTMAALNQESATLIREAKLPLSKLLT